MHINTPLVAHVLYGVNAHMSRNYRYPVHLETTPQARSAKNSASRAVEVLRSRGMLALLDNSGECTYGYVLTPSGLEIGVKESIEVDGLAFRLSLLENRWWRGWGDNGKSRESLLDKSNPLWVESTIDYRKTFVLPSPTKQSCLDGRSRHLSFHLGRGVTDCGSN
jgi:hypothetical protein